MREKAHTDALAQLIKPLPEKDRAAVEKLVGQLVSETRMAERERAIRLMQEVAAQTGGAMGRAINAI